MIIITDCGTIENSKNQEIHVFSAEQKQASLEAGWIIHAHVYKITYQHKVYEVHCPEISRQKTGCRGAFSWTPAQGIPTEKGNGAGERMLIVPEWMTPHRPYPLSVYLFAIHLYCSEPEISQREAARRTREYFGLDTFSHTTLGRALKVLETALLQAESATAGSESDASGAAKEKPETGKHNDPGVWGGSGFPTRQDTEGKRKRVLGFLGEKFEVKNRQAFEIAANALASAWFLKTGRPILLCGTAPKSHDKLPDERRLENGPKKEQRADPKHPRN
jgi:hypothetical protein